MNATKGMTDVLEVKDEEETTVLERQAVELMVGIERFGGKAEIKLELTPVPGLYLYAGFEDTKSALVHALSSPRLGLDSLFDENGLMIDAVAAGGSVKSDGTQMSKWRLQEPFKVRGDDETRMEELVAQIYNFETYLWRKSTDPFGVLEFGYGPWKGRIKLVENGVDRIAKISETGCYRITHTVEVSQGGECFSGSDAEDFLQSMQTFLSFAGSRICNLVCPTGRDGNGKEVWVRLSSPTEARKPRLCWFNGQDPSDPLVELLPKFMDRWTNDGWRDALRTGVWWYTRANSGSVAVDEGMVAAQIAMERMAYEYLVCDRELITKRQFNNRCFKASDLYRKMLRQLGIPVGIPDAAKILKTSGEWEDAPHALTKIRNDLVHAGTERTRLPDGCYREAWLMATHILELTILAVCGFNGAYSNRMTGRRELVPWNPEGKSTRGAIMNPNEQV